MTESDQAVDRLHAAPLEDFVAERKRLAKELRGAGEREAAAELARFPKPTPPAWALNSLAREDPAAVAEWLDAAAGLREATENADKSSCDAVRAAIAAHRDATRSLLAAVRDRTRPNGRELSEPMLDRVRDLVGAATADPELAELLRAGRIVEGGSVGDEPEDGELLWGAEMAGPAAKRAPAAKRRGAAADPASGATKSRGAKGDDAAAERRAAKEREAREREEAELQRLVAEAEERLAELQEAAEKRAIAAAEAEEKLEEARRTLHRSESEAGAAREAAEEAAGAADQVERELRALTAKLSS